MFCEHCEGLSVRQLMANRGVCLWLVQMNRACSLCSYEWPLMMVMTALLVEIKLRDVLEEIVYCLDVFAPISTI